MAGRARHLLPAPGLARGSRPAPHRSRRRAAAPHCRRSSCRTPAASTWRCRRRPPSATSAAAETGSSSSSTRSDDPIAVDQPSGSERVDLDPVQCRLQSQVDELLLALGPAEVGGRILVPLVVAILLVVAAAGIGQRLHAVEDVASRFGDVQPGADVARGEVDADLHAAEGIDQRLEPEKSIST